MLYAQTTYRTPNLRGCAYHPLYRERIPFYHPYLTPYELARIWATEPRRFRRMRRDEHPDDYEVAFLTSLFVLLDRIRRDDIEFEDWFNEQPVLTQNSIRERARLKAAGVPADRLPPVYRPAPPTTGCEGQIALAL